MKGLSFFFQQESLKAGWQMRYNTKNHPYKLYLRGKELKQ